MKINPEDDKNELALHEGKHLISLSSETKRLIDSATSENTKLSYGSGFRHFAGWCIDHNLSSLPATPETLAAYITHYSESLKISTLRHRVTVVNQAHECNGMEAPGKNPMIRKLLKGIAKEKGTRPDKAAPLMLDHIKEIVRGLDKEIAGKKHCNRALRDKALFLIGFAGAFRRSELCAMKVVHLTFEDRGVKIFIPSSKTDQEGAGAFKGIRYGHGTTCPVETLKTWVDALAWDDFGNKEKFVFPPIMKSDGILRGGISGETVRQIIKRVTRTYLDESIDLNFTGHSLRRGFINEGVERGVPERSLIKTTGHKSISTFRDYVDEFDVWRDNDTGNLGL